MDLITSVETIIGTLIFIWIMRTVLTFRSKISSGVGMMTAMSMGMMTGLLGGAIVGVLNPDGLMHSTIIGVLIGLVGGFTTGLPFSILAVLDGSLSGMMGGMMGVMLGDMVASNQGAILLEYMFWMYICFTLILIYLLYDVITIKLPLLIRSPLLLAIILGFSFFAFEQIKLRTEEINKENVRNSHTLHEKRIEASTRSLDHRTRVVATDSFTFEIQNRIPL